MSETILVTGGAGFVGSHLVDALLQEGHRVRVLDNLEPQVHGSLREVNKWPDYCNPEAEYIFGDVRDGDILKQVLEGVNVVYHLAAMVGVGQSMYEIERYVDVNSRGTAVLLDILVNDDAVRHSLRKLVVASSMSIYGEGQYECPQHGVVYPRLRSRAQLTSRQWELRCPVPITDRQSSTGRLQSATLNNWGNADVQTCDQLLKSLPTAENKPQHATSVYAISKKDQEDMCLAVGRAYNLPTVALRYFNIYGSRQALSNPYTGVAAIFSGRLLNGKSPVIFEDGYQTRDFVHVSDVVQANLLAMERAEMDYGAFNVGTGRATSILDVAEALVEHLSSPVEPEITQEFRAGDIRHCVADISRLRALGYVPRVTFADGVSELVHWVRSQSVTDSFEQARDELVKRGLAT